MAAEDPKTDVIGFTYEADLNEITLKAGQIILIECDSGQERKYWHSYAETRKWQHLAVRTDKFHANITVKCKECGWVHYVAEMPLSCCEYDAELKYCDKCPWDEELECFGRNVIDLTDPDYWKSPDATFDLNAYTMNAVAMGPELPAIPKKKRRNRPRRRPVDESTENMKRSESGHQYIITTSV